MVLESRPLLHVLFRQWSSCRSRSMCLVPIHFSWKDTNGLQVLGFVNPWRNPSRYDSLIRWLLQWYIAHSGTSLVNVYYCSLLIEKCWALRNWKFVYHEGFPQHFWFAAGFPQAWMHEHFVYAFVCLYVPWAFLSQWVCDHARHWSVQEDPWTQQMYKVDMQSAKSFPLVPGLTYFPSDE